MASAVFIHKPHSVDFTVEPAIIKERPTSFLTVFHLYTNTVIMKFYKLFLVLSAASRDYFECLIVYQGTVFLLAVVSQSHVETNSNLHTISELSLKVASRTTKSVPPIIDPEYGKISTQ